MAGETEQLGLPLRKYQVEKMQALASLNMYNNWQSLPEPGSGPMACVFPTDAFNIGDNSVWTAYVQESTLIVAEGLGLDVSKGGIVAKLDELWLWPQGANPESCKPRVKSVTSPFFDRISSSLLGSSLLHLPFLHT